MKGSLLIIDDEPSIRKVLAAHLRRDGYSVDTAPDGESGISRLARGRYDAVVTDLKMPGAGGLEVLSWVRSNEPGLPVIVITAHGTVGSAVEAIKLGARDYVTKPFDRDELKLVIDKAVRSRAAADRGLAAVPGRFAIVGGTPSMRRVYELIARVADSPTTVLITGESGTGKELVARALHEQSSRSGGPFVTVNCGAIPEHLFESELFGHERGAFTGAVAAHPGRFELADGGTIFLDEVGELPVEMQVKLLRVLQERSFERVGGVRPIEVDVRLVASTNRDLAADVEGGRFRQDLYYRLHVIPIELPPLRDRVEDVPLLANHFIARFNQRLGRRVRGISPEAVERLCAWRWPGNIRELENAMERAVLLCDGDTIRPSDLDGIDPRPELPPPPSAELGDMDLKSWVRSHTARLEADRIRQALEAEGRNVTRAARRLGISRKSLQVKMKEYGLRDEG